MIRQKIKCKNALSLMAINLIPSLFLVYFDNLFKFMYYRWTHQESESSLSYSFSNVTLPSGIIALKDKIKADFRRNDNNTFILDPNIFVNTMNCILYYYRRKLITVEELQLLKNELAELIDLMENIMQTGVFAPGARFYFYLASINIESNSSYVEYDNQATSHFLTFTMNPVAIHNSEICRIHKKHLESLQKYSTLITQSNEILQVKYITQQRKYIQNTGDDIPSILF
jgi:hypothetical protein